MSQYWWGVLTPFIGIAVIAIELTVFRTIFHTPHWDSQTCFCGEEWVRTAHPWRPWWVWRLIQFEHNYLPLHHEYIRRYKETKDFSLYMEYRRRWKELGY